MIDGQSKALNVSQPNEKTYDSWIVCVFHSTKFIEWMDKVFWNWCIQFPESQNNSKPFKYIASRNSEEKNIGYVLVLLSMAGLWFLLPHRNSFWNEMEPLDEALLQVLNRNGMGERHPNADIHAYRWWY